jgi:Transcriptional regulator, AbiEi antitoxin
MRRQRPSQQPTSAAVAELAATQHGVVTAEQLGRLGYSRRKISREAGAGRLHPVQRGVYAVGHPGLTTPGRCLAAVLSCGQDALLSHESAAWMWGISIQLPSTLEITAGTERRSRPGLKTHSARTLHPDDRASTGDVPVTAVPRTLLDLAASRESSLRWALPRAKRLGLLDLPAIDAMLGRSHGRRGVRRLRQGLERFRLPAFTRSDTELRFLALVKNAGLPRPSMNFFEAGYELDAYWPELRFAIELDTYEYHGDEISFEKDRLRQEELKLMGIELVRITGRRLDREPTAVAARLARLLEQRSRELGRDP